MARFYRKNQQVINKSFQAVGLTLPIQRSCDSRYSINPLDTADLTATLKARHLDRLNAQEADLVETSRKDDQNEFLNLR